MKLVDKTKVCEINMTSSVLRIIVWNANGFKKTHCNELELFLKDKCIDIALISKTYFTSKSYFRIIGYTVYYTTHPSNRVHIGSAINVKNNIKHCQDQEFRHNFLQYNVITNQLNVAAVYYSPKHSIKKENFEMAFQCFGNRVLFRGDFNSKHTMSGSHLIPPKGR